MWHFWKNWIWPPCLIFWSFCIHVELTPPRCLWWTRLRRFNVLTIPPTGFFLPGCTPTCPNAGGNTPTRRWGSVASMSSITSPSRNTRNTTRPVHTGGTSRNPPGRFRFCWHMTWLSGFVLSRSGTPAPRTHLHLKNWPANSRSLFLRQQRIF